MIFGKSVLIGLVRTPLSALNFFDIFLGFIVPFFGVTVK